MKHEPWLKSQLEYGHDLIHSAVEGARAAEEHARTAEPLAVLLTRSALASLPWAAVGASVGLLAVSSGRKHQSIRNQILFGLLGAVIGFGTNVAFSTRQLTGQMVHGAVRNINTARDAHWLAKHPVDYA
jgi:RsiW-degrading membrane proteinase PrsW (M82 family)